MKKFFKTFKEWIADKDPPFGYNTISEVGTSTADCASFKSPVIGGPQGPPVVRRRPWEILYKGPEKK